MNKCEECNKHKVEFKNMETNEEVCLWCAIKMQYKLQGLKGVYKTLRFYLKSKWILEWEDSLLKILSGIILIIISVITVLSFMYVLYTKQYLLILNSLISLFVILYLWRN